MKEMEIDMINNVLEDLENINIGNPQEYEGMTIIPLYWEETETDYLSLKEALDKEELIISEVNHKGSVEELCVKNLSKKPVLLIDGEELIGAKQNRILNTTILVPAEKEMIIPVNCTEQGRWRYISSRFNESEVMATNRVRRATHETVTASLHLKGRYKADQRMVWNKINQLSIETEVESPTHAMRDLYHQRMDKLNEYYQHLTLQENQTGLIVFLQDKIYGLDILMDPKIYQRIHEKLIKSYALEALLIPSYDKSLENAKKSARNFINQIVHSNWEKHKSLGEGWDYRFESNQILGSALIYQDNLVHGAFFPREDKNVNAEYLNKKTSPI